MPVGPNLNQKQMQLRKHYQTTLAVLDEPAAEDNPLALARRAENAVARIQKTVCQLVSSRAQSPLKVRRGWRWRQSCTHRSRLAHPGNAGGVRRQRSCHQRMLSSSAPPSTTPIPREHRSQSTGDTSCARRRT